MNTAYPLYPITLLVILAFAITRIFAYWEIFSLRWHRKFWNYLLLIAFLVSGLLGLLSIVKINYKLDIPGYENYLKYHVAFGIALVIIAIFHFSWHLNYYFRLVRKEGKEKAVQSSAGDAGKEQLSVLLFLLGLVAIINQVVFIREFISVLSGNELVVGIIMSAWMLLTGWGALYARKGDFGKFSLKRGIYMLAALTIFPMALIASLYLVKNLLFPPGTMINIGNSLVAAFLLLFPVCFISGYLFTAFSTFYSLAGKENLTGKSYSVESLGSLVGGALFSIVLGRLFNSFEVLGISASIVLIGGAWMIRKKKDRSFPGFLFAGLILPAGIFIFNPDNFIKKISFPNQELITNQSTRYGNLVVTGQVGQINVYEDNHLQFYTENVMLNEEAVHFAMVQHENPQKVLLISGGIAGMITEILKYDVKKITYLESNPEIFRLLKDYTGPLPDSGRVEVIKSDIRKFIAETDQSYDIILINLPPPSSLGLNRFYTEEFFELLKKHCDIGTVVCTSLPSTANYAEENALQANSSLWKTMGLFYRHRMLVMGEKNYFLGSDTPLSSSITARIAEKNIPTEYVNLYYIDDKLLEARSENLVTSFTDSVPVNRDFYPFLFVKQISHWLSYFGARYHLLILVPALLFLLFFFRTDRITAGLYTGGFTAASLEVTLLLAYQVYFGSIYLATALFFAVFMAGLAFGSSLKCIKSLPVIKSYYRLQFLLAAFAVILPFLIQFGGKMTGWPLLAQLLFFLLIFLLATGIGYEFLLASHLRQKSYSETSGINYSTDLAGSAFGAFLAALVMLPLMGLVKTCLIVAGLNVVSGVMAYSGRKVMD